MFTRLVPLAERSELVSVPIKDTGLVSGYVNIAVNKLLLSLKLLADSLLAAFRLLLAFLS